MPYCKKCCRTAKLVCPTCKRCGRCRCTCSECIACSDIRGKRVVHAAIVECEYCGMCRRACECKHRANGHVLSSARLSPEYGGIHSTNKVNRAVSVEVELCDFAGLDTRAFDNFTYRMTRDGSVHGSEMEMVISGLRGDKVVAAMAELAMEMELAGATYDESCGFHVHVDSRDLSWWNIRAAALLWEKFGKQVAYPYLHPDRAGNVNCAPLWNHPYWPRLGGRLGRAITSHDIKESIYELCGTKFVDNFTLTKMALAKTKKNKYGIFGVGNHDARNIRYYDLNLFSHVFRGTIEFRSMHMTSDPLELTGWPLLCLNLINLTTKKGEQWLRSCQMQDIYDEMPPIVKVLLNKKTGGIFKDKEIKVCAA